MRLRLATTFSATILGVLALSIASSMLTLYAAWRIHYRLEEAHKETLPSVRGEDVEIILLERNTLVTSYLLDQGNPLWRTRLRQLQQQFRDWIAKVRSSPSLPEEEQAVVRRLEKTWAELDARQQEAFALHDEGELEKARSLLLSQVNGRLSKEARDRCEQFILVDNRHVSAIVARADRRIRVTTWMVGISVVLTLCLSGMLLWLFFYRVLFPLRGMMADARLFRVDRRDGGATADEDELRAMGNHLRNLMSDMTDARSRLERSRLRLAAAEKLASVGRLAATVAHEIRNPLTAIKMWLFSIQEAAEGNADLCRKLGIISEEITRLESIIRKFLEFSRPMELKCRPQEVGLVIGQTLGLLEPRLKEGKIRVTRGPGGGLPAVMADADKLKQVLLNLLGNAADAMAGGGEVRLATTVEKDADGRRMVVLRIRDTGPGISQDVRGRIFEPFFTTKESGTGLGLCIAAHIMARHGGSLVLESSTEAGTTFAVWLPAAAEGTHGQDPGS
jgi:signal transduction histidine kinase